MGFDRKKCEMAIKETHGNTEEAMNMIILNLENPSFG